MAWGNNEHNQVGQFEEQSFKEIEENRELERKVEKNPSIGLNLKP